jgi:hypothetical protein
MHQARPVCQAVQKQGSETTLPKSVVTLFGSGQEKSSLTLLFATEMTFEISWARPIRARKVVSDPTFRHGDDFLKSAGRRPIRARKVVSDPTFRHGDDFLKSAGRRPIRARKTPLTLLFATEMTF